MEYRWCYSCNETKLLNYENFAYADKAHTKFRNKCRKCTNYDSMISHRIHRQDKHYKKKIKEINILC